MKHTFSFREKILILICAVLAVGIFYYEAVYRYVTDSVEKYSTVQLEDELTAAQIKATQEVTMKKAISDTSATAAKGTIAVYNNLANEVNALGSILNGNADKVAITWGAPTLTDTTVRRQANISFQVADYTSARALVQAISDNPYRNIISNVTISNSTNSTGTTAANLTVTFFETTSGAASTEGLVQMNSSSTTN